MAYLQDLLMHNHIAQIGSQYRVQQNLPDRFGNHDYAQIQHSVPKVLCE